MVLRKKEFLPYSYFTQKIQNYLANSVRAQKPDYEFFTKMTTFNVMEKVRTDKIKKEAEKLSSRKPGELGFVGAWKQAAKKSERESYCQGTVSAGGTGR